MPSPGYRSIAINEIDRVDPFHQPSGADDQGFVMLSADADFAISVVENRQRKVAVNVHPQHVLVEGAMQGIEKANAICFSHFVQCDRTYYPLACNSPKRANTSFE